MPNGRPLQAPVLAGKWLLRSRALAGVGCGAYQMVARLKQRGEFQSRGSRFDNQMAMHIWKEFWIQTTIFVIISLKSSQQFTKANVRQSRHHSYKPNENHNFSQGKSTIFLWGSQELQAAGWSFVASFLVGYFLPIWPCIISRRRWVSILKWSNMLSISQIQ